VRHNKDGQCVITGVPTDQEIVQNEINKTEEYLLAKIQDTFDNDWNIEKKLCNIKLIKALIESSFWIFDSDCTGYIKAFYRKSKNYSRLKVDSIIENKDCISGELNKRIKPFIDYKIKID